MAEINLFILTPLLFLFLTITEIPPHASQKMQHQRSTKWQIPFTGEVQIKHPAAALSTGLSPQLTGTLKPGANLTTPVIKLKKVPNLNSTACLNNLSSIKHTLQQCCHKLNREH